MSPFYFGTGQRRLFGLYTPGIGGGARARAAVLCYPWGQEYLRAHRTMKMLASMLTAKGIHVLRFDYFGTGDSTGDMTEADVPGWEHDIETAIEEIRDTTDARQVALVGMRLGATLAARVAARPANGVDALVLWDPVVSGHAYMQELLGRSGHVANRSPDVGGGYEVLGFPLTAAMLAEFESLDLVSLVSALPARTLVVTSGELPSHGHLAEALAKRAAMPIAIESILSQAPWVKPRGAGDGTVPVPVLQRIAEWLA